MGSRKVYSSAGRSSYHLGSAKDRIAASRPQDAKPYSGQSYDTIKQSLLSKGALFEDPMFPAENKSLFFSREPPRPFVWKRPKEIVDDPHLFVGGASRFDITQGMLGDCWLLAAIASLTEYKNLLYQVVPQDQDFDSKDYCGMFRFRFWQYGNWQEVVIDDRLPTYNNRLVFVHSNEGKEFWSALLEKAYAKLVGSYEALKGGQTSEAMVDFTGGVTEVFDLKKPPADLFKILLKNVARQSMMCCSIEAKPNEIEAKAELGLIKGHAYSLTGVRKVKARTRSGSLEVELVRIRNPWGNEREWEGAWGDSSSEWQLLSDAEKKELGLTFDDDGEFWMSLSDFLKYYTRLEVCMLSPDSAVDTTKKGWEMQVQQGSWQKQISAGGCRNFPDTFHLNPQYRVKLEDPDDDEDVDNCTIVVGLLQRDRRRTKKLGSQNLTIGFAIYRLEDDVDDYMDGNRLSKDYFLYHKSFARSATFINSRELTGRFSLPPGEYVILPSTFKSEEEGDFVLRLFSEKAHNSNAMDTQTQIEYKPQQKMGEEESNAFDQKFKGFYDKIAGQDAEIDAFEFQQILTMAFRKEFGTAHEVSLEASRSLVAMCDVDRSGKMDYEEFKKTWTTTMQWKNCFKDYDKDGSGDMDAIELRGALSKLGFKLSTPALSSLVLRYTNKKGKVAYDDFIQICCRVRSAFNSFINFQGQRFSLDDYIMSSVYV